MPSPFDTEQLLAIADERIRRACLGESALRNALSGVLAAFWLVGDHGFAEKPLSGADFVEAVGQVLEGGLPGVPLDEPSASEMDTDND